MQSEGQAGSDDADALFVHVAAQLPILAENPLAALRCVPF